MVNDIYRLNTFVESDRMKNEGIFYVKMPIEPKREESKTEG